MKTITTIRRSSILGCLPAQELRLLRALRKPPLSQRLMSGEPTDQDRVTVESKRVELVLVATAAKPQDNASRLALTSTLG